MSSSFSTLIMNFLYQLLVSQAFLKFKYTPIDMFLSFDEFFFSFASSDRVVYDMSLEG